jgi:hypothetical protein
MANAGNAIAAFGASFLTGFLGAKNQQMNHEMELMQNAISIAMQQGDVTALSLLDPNKLATYGLDQFMPTYMKVAQTVGQQRQMEQRRLQALTQQAESQSRVGAATEEQQIKTAGLQTQRAEQQVTIGGMELEQAGMTHQMILDNPKLLALPFEEKQAAIKDIESRIADRTEQRKIAWANLSMEGARLGEAKRHNLAQEGIAAAQIRVGQRIEEMTIEELNKLPPEDRSAAIVARFAPGMESNARQNFKMYNDQFSNANKLWQGVLEKIGTAAAKAGKEPLTYDTEEAALADLQRINGAAAQQNSLADILNTKFGDTRPMLTEFEMIPMLGILGGTKGYQLVPKQKDLKSEIADLLGISQEELEGKPIKTERATAPASKVSEASIATARERLRVVLKREPTEEEVMQIAPQVEKAGPGGITAKKIFDYLQRPTEFQKSLVPKSQAK